MNEREEKMEHGARVNENRPMKGNRASGEMPNDPAYCIQRAGGEDARRYDAKIMIDRVVQDHDMSGYNHNGVKTGQAEAALGNNEHMAKMERRADNMGTPYPDGTYSR